MSASTAPKVDLDRPQGALRQLGLDHAADELAGQANEAVKHNYVPHVFSIGCSGPRSASARSGA